MGRTPRSQYAALFNFAGSGFVHMELFPGGPTMPYATVLDAITLRGTHADRPSSVLIPIGTKYHETDTKNGFVWDGSTWLALWEGPSAGAALLNVRVTRSTSQSTTNNGTPSITFDTEAYKDGITHSTVTDSDRLTFVTPGVYGLGTNIKFADNSVGSRAVNLELNGTTTIAALGFAASALLLGRMPPLKTEYHFDEDDYVRVITFQNSGGNLDVEAASDYAPAFWAHLIAAD